MRKTSWYWSLEETHSQWSRFIFFDTFHYHHNIFYFLYKPTMSEEQEERLLPPPPSEGNSTGNNQPRLLRGIASVMGSTGVAMGAFGAHALKEALTNRGTVAMWQTATIYQLFHAAAVLSLAASASSEEETIVRKKHFLAGKLMGAGNLLFSGSIYCLSLGVGPKKILGPITPLGGLLMIGGWVVVGFM